MHPTLNVKWGHAGNLQGSYPFPPLLLPPLSPPPLSQTLFPATPFLTFSLSPPCLPHPLSFCPPSHHSISFSPPSLPLSDSHHFPSLPPPHTAVVAALQESQQMSQLQRSISPRVANCKLGNSQRCWSLGTVRFGEGRNLIRV